jgi:transcriptional regulator with XRE-family HTH domain
MPTFGEKLRTLRKRAKMTQQELADRLGYTDQSFIAYIERSKRNPTVEMVLKVSNLFQVTTDQLIRDELDLDLSSGTTSDTDEPS